MSEHFVGVAADDVAYNNLSEANKGKREFQFLKQALADGGASIHQGVYAITPSGKFLGKIDTGWPTYDPVESLQNLKKAKAKFDSMDKKAKLMVRPFMESDRSLVPVQGEKLKGGTKLITLARHYPFKEMELFDSRHPQYSKRDSLWLSESETKGLIPAALTVGASGDISTSAVERLLLHGHLMFGCPAWWKEHIKKADLKVKVTKIQGDKVYLEYSGDFLMDANSEWNKSSYDGNLLGRACWNKAKGEFESLEWVTAGKRSLQELKSNLHRGTTKTTQVAAYVRLANNSPQEQQLLPHQWNEYPKSVKD